MRSKFIHSDMYIKTVSRKVHHITKNQTVLSSTDSTVSGAEGNAKVVITSGIKLNILRQIPLSG